MNVFRITKKKYSSDISGKGAELFGGRWNPIGTPALYTSQNRALAILELLVHTPKEIVPPNQTLLTIEIPKELEGKLFSIDKLQDDWNSLQTNEWTQTEGLRYFKELNALGIIIPSALISLEKNIVLNPSHEDYQQIKIVEQFEFKFDKRLFQ